MSSMLETVGPDEKKKLEAFIEAAKRVLQEMADLRDGLKDTAKSLGEELGVKPAYLMKAGRVAFKSSLDTENEAHATLEEILTITGNA